MSNTNPASNDPGAERFVVGRAEPIISPPHRPYPSPIDLAPLGTISFKGWTAEEVKVLDSILEDEQKLMERFTGCVPTKDQDRLKWGARLSVCKKMRTLLDGLKKEIR